jgi:hypothetical protein
MPDPEGEEFDLEAMGNEIDGTTAPAEETQEVVADPAAESQTQADETAQTEEERAAAEAQAAPEIEIAGRKYKDLDALKRAHDHLYRHSSKLEQELAKERKWGDPFRNLQKLWRENPDLFGELKAAEAKYFAARQQGATPAQAKQVAQSQNVPPEVMQQLKELREWKSQQEFTHEESRLKQEFSALKAKHTLDDKTVDAVTAIMLEKAEKGVELSAEDAHELLLVRQNRMSKTELDRVRATADTGAAGQSQSRPAQRFDPRTADDAKFDAEVDRFVSGQGYRD